MIFTKLITDPKKITTLIFDVLERKSKVIISYFDQHCLNEYSTNKEYKEIIDREGNVYADGFGMNNAYKFLMGKNYSIFNSTDYYVDLIVNKLNKTTKVFFIGGKFDEQILKTKLNMYVNLIGSHNGFFDLGNCDEIIQTIKNANPDIILVGMGVPKQEIFAQSVFDKIDYGVIICVGNFMEFFTGATKRIPKNYRNSGLEWIYRLIHDPKRLWKRYLFGIPLFILRIIKFKMVLLRKNLL